MNDGAIPDAVSPIVGWRYWNLDEKGVLKSTVVEDRWEPKSAKTAICRPLPGQLDHKHVPHPSPHASCTCGCYAAKDLENLRKIVRFIYTNRLVVGEVSLWGRVIPAEHGFRSEFAYPKKLFIVPETFRNGDQAIEIAAGLGRLYGVETDLMPFDESRPVRYASTPFLVPRHMAFKVLITWTILGLALTGVRLVVEQLTNNPLGP